MEFEKEEDLNGLDIENTNLRKLYRILALPTTDFLHKKAKPKNDRSKTGNQSRVSL